MIAGARALSLALALASVISLASNAPSIAALPEYLAPSLDQVAPAKAAAFEPAPDWFPQGEQPTLIEELPPTSNVEFFPEFEGEPVEESSDPTETCKPAWVPQLLPEGLIYRSYLAGPKEPRFSAVFWHDRKLGWNLDYTVGGRLPLFRYGTQNAFWPEGFQVDLEGAAFPRVNLTQNMDLDAADYRVGIPFTYGVGRWQSKLAMYHLSAHVGDEFLVRHPNFQRLNYVRDAFVLGLSCYPVDPVRLYGEVEYAFNTDGGAKPWAFQFGFEYSPLFAMDFVGAPFLALNASLREDVDFGGNLVFESGWQWRGEGNRRLLRTGLYLLTGKSNQFEFYDQNETQLGWGLWYDF